MKRPKGTETGEIFPQGQILEEDLEEEEEAEDDKRVIACLFNHGELKSVFNHEYAFNNTDLVTVSRLDREAREEAEVLQERLRESRQQYMWRWGERVSGREENPIMSEVGRERFGEGSAKEREAVRERARSER